MAVTYLDLQALLFLLLGIDGRQQIPQLLIVDFYHVYLNAAVTDHYGSLSSL